MTHPTRLFQFWSRYRRLLFVLLFFAVLFVGAQWSGLRQHFSLPFLRQTLSDNPATGLVVFVLLFTLGNLIQVPGWIFLASAVLVLGKVAGGLETYLAASVSCAFTFVAVRWLGGDAVRNLSNPWARRLVTQLHSHPMRNVVLLRTLFQTLPALNYTLAMSGIGFRKYMAATLVGLPLPIAVYCLFFDYLARVAHLA
jgi:uncharacterized membrane protein YdjX (TVP38/TMEM64 family)